MLADLGVAVGVEQVEQGLAQKLVRRRGAEQPQTCLVCEYDVALAVDEDRHGSMFHEGAIALLALADLGAGLQLAGAPEEQRPEARERHEDESDPRREPAARAGRPQHLVGVLLGDDEPGCARHRLQGRQHGDAAVVDPLDHAAAAAHGHGRRQTGSVRRRREFERGVLPKAKLVEIQDLLSAPLHQERLTRPAGERPRLDQRIEVVAGVGAQGHRCDGRSAALRAGDRRDEVDARPAGGVQKHVGGLDATCRRGLRHEGSGLPVQQGWRGARGVQQCRVPRRGHDDLGVAVGAPKGVENGLQVGAGRRPAAGEHVSRGDGNERVGADHLGVAAPFLEPGRDLVGLELADGAQGVLGLNPRRLRLHTPGPVAGRGDQHGEHHEADDERPRGPALMWRGAHGRSADATGERIRDSSPTAKRSVKTHVAPSAVPRVALPTTYATKLDRLSASECNGAAPAQARRLLRDMPHNRGASGV